VKKKDRRRNEWRNLLLLHLAVLAAVLLYMTALVKLKIYCPIRYVTGVPCPGCGMSRALGCLLRLDFIGSLRCNPALGPCLVSLFVMINRETILLERLSLRTKDIVIGTGMGITILVYLIRMIFFEIP
jgi:Protein of unknown function (DUF2752).